MHSARSQRDGRSLIAGRRAAKKTSHTHLALDPATRPCWPEASRAVPLASVPHRREKGQVLEGDSHLFVSRASGAPSDYWPRNLGGCGLGLHLRSRPKKTAYQTSARRGRTWAGRAGLGVPGGGAGVRFWGTSDYFGCVAARMYQTRVRTLHHLESSKATQLDDRTRALQGWGR